jgi:small subunit ribosomal protein S17
MVAKNKKEAKRMEKEVACNDPNCPIHGSLKVRGNIFTAKVVSVGKMNRSAVVERTFIKKVRKYERLARERARLTVHKPDCIDVHVGDIVKIGETKRLSKTKSFVIIEVVKRAGE